MKKYLNLFIISVFVCLGNLRSQTCTTLGQTPATAFPVCGLDTFVQTTVPICTNANIIVPGCVGTATYNDKNPYWYRFTCYTAGTLGFLITPNNLSDDYDWQLFDITNHNPTDVYGDTSTFVVANWAGTYGLTGASNAGNSRVQCASSPPQNISTFSYMPTLIKGHTYLLMVSHYTNTQSGYKLSFGGGTASITDPALPTFLSAAAICGGDKIYFKTSKRIQCSSIAVNGSDFSLSTNAIGIDSAIGYGCDVGFDTDSIVIHLNNYLTPGNYTLTQKVGSDGNTLLDICKSGIAVGDNTSFNINAQQLLKAGFTYNIAYGCKYDVLYAYLGGRNIANFAWYVDGTLYTQPNIVITYNSFGDKSIKLVASNSVCSDSTTVNFNLPTPGIKAAFSAAEFVCPNDTISFTDQSKGVILSWNWDFGNGVQSTMQNPPAQSYNNISLKEVPVRLVITDAACSDTTYRIVKIIPNCYIAVPSAFTPNGDGLNDYLYPLNAYKAINLTFRVYNRYGQVIFESHDKNAKWDGKLKSNPQASGTYVWVLEYTESDTGKKISQKGTTVLIR